MTAMAKRRMKKSSAERTRRARPRKKAAPQPPPRHEAILANPDLVLTNLQKAKGKNFFQQLFGRLDDDD
jgi:hypothetical protein